MYLYIFINYINNLLFISKKGKGGYKANYYAEDVMAFMVMVLWCYMDRQNMDDVLGRKA